MHDGLLRLVEKKISDVDGRAMSLIEDYGELWGQDALLFGLGSLYDDIEDCLCRDVRECVIFGVEGDLLFFAKPSVVWGSMAKRLQGMESSEVESMFNMRNGNSSP